MLKIVVDVNVVIAAAIKDEATRELLFNNNWQLLVPEHFFSELEKYRKLIKEKTSYADDEFELFIVRLLGLIKPISFVEFYDSMAHAREICPDEKDVMYFALALKLNCPIWSNDKRLKNQNEIKVYSTEDLMIARNF